jgi:hypothetical protein
MMYSPVMLLNPRRPNPRHRQRRCSTSHRRPWMPRPKGRDVPRRYLRSSAEGDYCEYGLGVGLLWGLDGA